MNTLGFGLEKVDVEVLWNLTYFKIGKVSATTGLLCRCFSDITAAGLLSSKYYAWNANN